MPTKPEATSRMTVAPDLEPLIIEVRGHKVLLDADLAALYGVPTKALNQAVRRNADRFPADFSFVLTPAEKAEVVTNCDHLARLKFSPVHPRAFTEHGALMAAHTRREVRRGEDTAPYRLRLVPGPDARPKWEVEAPQKRQQVLARLEALAFEVKLDVLAERPTEITRLVTEPTIICTEALL